MISGTCYEIDVANQPASVESLFSFDKNLKYYQKQVGKGNKGMLSGAAIIGRSLTWSQRPGVFVFGSPNFNLGLPSTGKRYMGFGNILRFGRYESGKDAITITKNKRVLNNPTKGRGEVSGFREALKNETRNVRNQNGTAGDTPGLYLGWTVITGM